VRLGIFNSLLGEVVGVDSSCENERDSRGTRATCSPEDTLAKSPVREPLVWEWSSTSV
jgi:hypothetical protein